MGGVHCLATCCSPLDTPVRRDAACGNARRPCTTFRRASVHDSLAVVVERARRRAGERHRTPANGPRRPARGGCAPGTEPPLVRQHGRARARRRAASPRQRSPGGRPRRRGALATGHPADGGGPAARDTPALGAEATPPRWLRGALGGPRHRPSPRPGPLAVATRERRSAHTAPLRSPCARGPGVPWPRPGGGPARGRRRSSAPAPPAGR
jgi:hypothetical protein